MILSFCWTFDMDYARSPSWSPTPGHSEPLIGRREHTRAPRRAQQAKWRLALPADRNRPHRHHPSPGLTPVLGPPARHPAATRGRRLTPRAAYTVVIAVSGLLGRADPQDRAATDHPGVGGDGAGGTERCPFIRDTATIGSATVVTVADGAAGRVAGGGAHQRRGPRRGTHALTRRRSALFGLIPPRCPGVAPRSESPAILGHFGRRTRQSVGRQPALRQ